MANLVQWLRQHIGLPALITIAILLTALFVPAAAVIVGGRDYEVSYTFSPTFSLCGKILDRKVPGITPDNCTTLYELKLANTGSKNQSRITLALPIEDAVVNQKGTLNLVASTTPIATVTIETGDHPGQYKINQFPPNTLIFVELETKGLKNAEALASGKIEVQAQGRVLNVNPRSAAFLRMLYVMMAVIGL